MVKSLVFGTLTTLSSLSSLVGGLNNSNSSTTHVFRLFEGTQSSDPQRAIPASALAVCSGAKASFLAMKIESQAGNYLTLNVQGQFCTPQDGVRPVLISMVLPADALDAAYLSRLPNGASYVVGKLPGNARVKITKQTPNSLDGLTPIELEWLPNEKGLAEHAPVTLWISPTAGAVPWARIKISELQRQFSDLDEPLTVSNEISPKFRR